MKRTVLSRFPLLLLALLTTVCTYAQTTVTTGLTGGTSASSGVSVFAVVNTNTFPIAITTFSIYHNTANNNKNYSVWYTFASNQLYAAAPNITVANGWTLLATGPNITATNTITPVVSNQYLVVPANDTVRIAIATNGSGNTYFATAGASSYANGNVTIYTGTTPTVANGYAGSFPTPSQSGRYFAGSINFITASVNNIAMLGLLTPTTPTTGYCSYDSVLVRAIIYNNGADPQSNFPITARYTGTSTGTISTTYTNTLQPFTRDTVVIGKLNLPQGTYSVKAYTQLSTDTIRTNDTSAASANFTFRRPMITAVTESDTVCPGGTVTLNVPTTINNTTYKWYPDSTAGSLLFTGTTVTIPNLMQDTIMYIASDSANCQGKRTMVIGKVVPPPAKTLGNDTSFCESIPLVLDAGNIGAKYLWSTGDTDQTIQITNVSGAYWVEVTQYCSNRDTINVNIRPMPFASGISYVRMGNTYYFNPSFVQNVESYHWIFGDGGESFDSATVHTYGPGINGALVVMLIVHNTCGEDTVYRSVPTAINGVDPEEQALKIYPNPAASELYVEAKNTAIENLYLINMTGSVVARFEQPNSSRSMMDISRMPKGNYILRVGTKDGAVVNRPIQIIH